MRNIQASLLALLFFVGVGGCADKSGPAPAGPAAAKATNSTNSAPGTPAGGDADGGGFRPTQAQPRLATMKLFVGPEVITAELATNQVQVGTGMMFRKSMAESEGMLFIFGRAHRTAFYMRNTTVPLSAAYIDPEGTILEVVDLHPLVETPVEAKFDNVQFVLEMNQGWFKRHNIAPGAVISTETGTLRKTFFLR